MSRPVRIALIVGVLGLLAWVAAAPYLTVNAMRHAAERGDAAAVARHIDFPALRENLKSQLADAMRRRLGDGSGGWRDLGANLLASTSAPWVDALTSETAIATLFAGRDALSPARATTAGTAPTDAASASASSSASTPTPAPTNGGIATGDWHLRMGYQDFSTFTVQCDLAGDPALPATLVFERRNLVQWKLAAIDLSALDPAALVTRP